jgi:hypothetical protein
LTFIPKVLYPCNMVFENTFNGFVENIQGKLLTPLAAGQKK